MTNEAQSNLLDNVNKILTNFIPAINRRDSNHLYAVIGVQSHGTITFPDNKSNRAEFIRVPPDASVIHVKELLTRLWCNGRPSLVISVTGSVKEYNMKGSLLRAFRRGLLKVARTTGAWIITGGLNVGIMKLVGEIVQINPDRSRPIHLIGIAPWGCVSGFQQLDVRGSNVHYVQPNNNQLGEVPLEPNHTEFIFVDDGTIQKYGREIAFRAKLEAAISDGFFSSKNTVHPNLQVDYSEPVPVILLVVGGGPNTLRTVHESVVQNKIPAVLLDGTGPCCNLFAKAYRLYNREFYDGTSTDVDPDTLSQRHEEFKSKLREQVKHQLHELCGKTLNEGSNDDYITSLFELVYECLHEGKHLLNIVTLDSHNQVELDIDLFILQALLNATSGNDTSKTNIQQKREQLYLAFEWNRVDIAKKYIMKTDADWKSIDLNDLFLLALERNQITFVKLFLDHDFSLTDLFRNNDKILKLYMNDMTEFDPYLKLAINDPLQAIYKEIIQPLIGDFFDVDAILPTTEYDDDEHPTMTYIDGDKELFLWSIITGRKEFALLFWSRGKNKICAALIATLIYRKRARKDNDYSYDRQADEFENLAVQILNKFDEANPNACARAIVRQIPVYGNVTWLELAIAAEAKQFIAQKSIQYVLNNIWFGYIDQRVSVKKIIFSTIMLWYSGLLPYHNELVKTNSDIEDSNNKSYSSRYQSSKAKEAMKRPTDAVEMRLMEDTLDVDNEPAVDFIDFGCWEKTRSMIIRYFTNIITFMRAPYVKYLYDLYFTVIFLLLFSYVLLCDLFPMYDFPKDVCGPIQARSYQKDDDLLVNDTLIREISNNKSSVSSQYVRYNRPAISELILIIWIFTLFCEQIRQFFSIEAQSFRNVLRIYFGVFWNKLDFFGIILFIIGIILRYLPSAECYCAARIILSIDLTIWFIRSLNIFTIVRQLGPKLVMMGEMIYDLKFFILMLTVIILAFGVSSYSFIYGVQTFSWHMPREIINFVFWPIFGEFNSLLTFEHNYKASGYAAFIFLVVYMIIVSIFLVNFLIAMFSNTFDRLQTDTDRIWKFQRYSLVYEYLSRPSLPPPFIFFSHLYRFILFLFGRCIKLSCFQEKYHQHINRMTYKILLGERAATHIEIGEDALGDEVYYSYLKPDQDTSQNMFNEIQTLKNQIQTITNQQAHMIEYLECLMDSLHENQG